MNIIHEKLERLDQAILNGAATAELRGYIVDIRDHMAARQERDLTTELEIIRAELIEATKQNTALKAQLKDAQSALEQATKPKDTAHQNRPEPEHQILLLLMSRDGLNHPEVARHLKFGEQAARHHLTQLDTAGLIRWIPRLGPNSKWYLSDAGRSYLHARGLLQ